MTEITNQGNKDTRSGFGAGLTQLGKTHPEVVALCADLIGSLKMQPLLMKIQSAFFK
jgi:transketolase